MEENEEMIMIISSEKREKYFCDFSEKAHEINLKKNEKKEQKQLSVHVVWQP